MRIGLVLPLEVASDGEPPAIAIAERAEAIGFDSVWAYDHFFANMPDEPPRTPVHEAWTIVSAVAARTSRVEIGQLFMCTAYRPPGLLAKMAATADAVSGGRITLGIGAGWHSEEYRAFGYPFDHRVDRFEETVKIIAPLVRGETVSFRGDYHETDEAVLLPLQRPIPLLIASFGQRMLRLTARHADAWNTAWYGMPDDKLHRAFADVEAALEAEHREPSSLRRTVGIDAREPETEGEGVPIDDLPKLFEAYEALGVDDVILGFEAPNERTLDRLERVLPSR
jgi:alkanesulfonate monooxygenase SsuD/methylene tetrahydromethanopterin reductase-like flavin-dependent oxidoreductase (luciferase family)